MSKKPASIRDVSLRLLTRREHSRQELLQKLQSKGFSKETITTLLDELAEQGWQSDERYAESYARHRIMQGFGPIAIAYELRQNGVEAVDLDNLAETLGGGWQELLLQAYRKKYPDNPVISRAEWVKRYRFLLQRGFPAGLVSDLPKQLPIQLV